MGLHEICSYELLTEREVRMAGYWPGSIFAFKNAEKNEANIQPPRPNRLG